MPRERITECFGSDTNRGILVLAFRPPKRMEGRMFRGNDPMAEDDFEPPSFDGANGKVANIVVLLEMWKGY